MRSRVLIVDDDKDVVVLLRHHLCAAGYEVMHALDGLEGLAMAVGEAPDIVVSDILMPEFDGFGLLAALRANAPTRSMPIVFLTVVDDLESVARATRLGVDGYLRKPVQRDALLEMVAAKLKLARRRQSALAACGVEAVDGLVAGDALLARDFAYSSTRNVLTR